MFNTTLQRILGITDAHLYLYNLQQSLDEQDKRISELHLLLLQVYDKLDATKKPATRNKAPQEK